MRLGVLLALVGGALDAYTFVSRGGVFANAQTGNVVLLGIEAARGNWAQTLRHVPAVLAFVLGVVLARWLSRPRMARVVRRPIRAVLILEIVVLAGVGLMPAGSADVAATILVAFTASMQVTTFRQLVDTPYSTTMTTGNLRTATESAYLALADRDREQSRRAGRFGVIVAAFLVGAVAGGVLSDAVGIRAVWGPALVLVLSLALFIHDERIAARSRNSPEGDGPYRGGGL
ncbi:YoaK family protein [Streptomyces sp. NPDC004561]